MDDGALAAAWSAQDGGNLARHRINSHMLQRRYARRIREGDICKADMSPRPSQLFGLGCVGHWGLGVQHLKEALPRGDRPRQAIDDARRLAYREGELVHVQDELAQAAGRQMATNDFPA